MSWTPEPDDKGRLFDHYDVVIRRNSDGVERVYHEDCPWHSSSDFWWFEGNAACDCNRSLFFNRAGGDPDDDELECGDTKYTVVKFIFPDGTEQQGDSK